MIKLIPTTAKLPKSLHQQLLERVIKDGYGMRGKSRWINEAILQFLNLENYPELTDIAGDLEEKTDVISFRIPEELMLKIENSIKTIRKEYPIMEGVKSNIIRASILQRLIRT